jgi:diacylglycerol kinase family enzyme
MAIAGGDGSLMFLAQDAIEIGVDLNDLTMCVLPFGTGNDLAKTLGWGIRPKKEWMNKLKSLVTEIVNS